MARWAAPRAAWTLRRWPRSTPISSLRLIHAFTNAAIVTWLQDPVDITKGVTDEQALKMATNLGFKGPLTSQVRMSS